MTRPFARRQFNAYRSGTYTKCNKPVYVDSQGNPLPLSLRAICRRHWPSIARSRRRPLASQSVRPKALQLPFHESKTSTNHGRQAPDPCPFRLVPEFTLRLSRFGPLQDNGRSGE